MSSLDFRRNLAVVFLSYLKKSDQFLLQVIFTTDKNPVRNFFDKTFQKVKKPFRSSGVVKFIIKNECNDYFNPDTLIPTNRKSSEIIVPLLSSFYFGCWSPHFVIFSIITHLTNYFYYPTDRLHQNLKTEPSTA